VRLLLDTNILIGLVDERLRRFDDALREVIMNAETAAFASVASLWEIAIKSRLGKLAISTALTELPEIIQHLGLSLVSIHHQHVLAVVEPAPATRDPFDRLLLAQCMVENLRLVTLDRVLAAHPLAFRAG
jgi:PIN domain nuclease of toxin-antitoxin system